MASKGSVIKAINAKPNQRAITSFKKPLYCNCGPHKDRDEIIALTSITKDGKARRKCAACFFNPPQRTSGTAQILKQLGLL